MNIKDKLGRAGGIAAAAVVIGVGGYSSGPVVLVAWLLRKPTAIQEQNALPGFTNRTLGRIVDAIFIAFPEAERSFPARKTHLLGNPIRRAFLDNYLHTKAPSERLSIFVTGGSQGAHVLNLRVAEALEMLAPSIGPRLQVLHQTGVKDQPEIAARYAALRGSGLLAEALAFLDDMPRAYAGADLLICRAGATTIAELTVCKKPAILVPFPYAADDHQTVNARSMVEAGAALLLALTVLVPALLGYQRYVITSGSMTGTYDRGSLVFDKVVPTSSLRAEQLDGPVDLRHINQWWTWTPGASWRF